MLLFFQILLVFIIGAFLIIARCANKSQASTYQDVVLYMCGPTAKMVSQILIIVYFFGGCITYLIIIGEQASKGIYLTFGFRGKIRCSFSKGCAFNVIYQINSTGFRPYWEYFGRGVANRTPSLFQACDGVQLQINIKNLSTGVLLDQFY